MTLLYSFKGECPEPLPFRITLPNGFTRTDPSSFTEEEIALAGFTGPYTKPSYNPETEQIDWINGEFVINIKPPAPPSPLPIDLSVIATGILEAAANNDAKALANLLNDLLLANHFSLEKDQQEVEQQIEEQVNINPVYSNSEGADLTELFTPASAVTSFIGLESTNNQEETI